MSCTVKSSVASSVVDVWRRSGACLFEGNSNYGQGCMGLVEVGRYRRGRARGISFGRTAGVVQLGGAHAIVLGRLAGLLVRRRTRRRGKSE